MTEITIKISDEKARRWLWFLRRIYGSKRAGLNKLAELAILEKVREAAKQELNDSLS